MMSTRIRRSDRAARVCTALAVLVVTTSATVVATAAASPAALQISVTPASDLVDGQTVQVAGTKFDPDFALLTIAVVCLATETDTTGCDVDNPGFARVAPDGSFSEKFRFRARSASRPIRPPSQRTTARRRHVRLVRSKSCRASPTA
jgi:hypothetical protein